MRPNISLVVSGDAEQATVSNYGMVKTLISFIFILVLCSGHTGTLAPGPAKLT